MWHHNKCSRRRQTASRAAQGVIITHTYRGGCRCCKSRPALALRPSAARATANARRLIGRGVPASNFLRRVWYGWGDRRCLRWQAKAASGYPILHLPGQILLNCVASNAFERARPTVHPRCTTLLLHPPPCGHQTGAHDHQCLHLPHHVGSQGRHALILHEFAPPPSPSSVVMAPQPELGCVRARRLDLPLTTFLLVGIK